MLQKRLRFIPLAVATAFAVVLAMARPSAVWADSGAQALSQARAKLDAQSSYHLHLLDERGVTDIDYMPPARVRITMPNSVALLIGGSVFLNAGGSGWVPAGVNPKLIILMKNLERDGFLTYGANDRIEDGGLEELDGVPTHRYDILTPANGVLLRRSIWVGTEDGLPHQVTRSNGMTKLLVTYSQFNQDFGIETPEKLAAPAVNMPTPDPRKNAKPF